MRRKKKNWPVAIAIDVETTGLNAHASDRAFSVPMLDEEGNEFYFEWPVNPKTREVQYRQKDLKKIEQILDQYEHWVFHNTKFDIRFLGKAGIDIEKLGWRERFQDTVLASHICCSNEPHDLKYIGDRYFDISTDDQKELQKFVIKCRREAKKLGWNLGEKVEQDYWLPAAIEKHQGSLPFDTDEGPCKTYAMTDVKRTILAWIMYRERMVKEGLYKNYERERLLLPVVYDMENRGVTIHPDRMKKEIARYNEMARSLEKKAKTVAAKQGFKDLNIDSNQQVVELVYKSKKGFRLKTRHLTPTGQMKLDAQKALPELLESVKEGSPAARFLHAFSSRKKASTAAKYLIGYDKLKIDHDGVWKLHGSYNQTGTDTTRFSASNPNPTNIGSGKKNDDGEVDYKLRYSFGPYTTRRWYCADYKQLQLRIIAYDSNDKAMIRAFEDGYDFHEYMAIRIYNCEVEDINKEMKRVAKAVNFGFSFGAGEKKIDGSTGITGLYQTVIKMFPNAHKYMEHNIAFAREHGYVNTMGGYRLYIDPNRAYIATNYRVQGTEGDIVKNAMIDIDRYLSQYDDHYLTLMVHDELDFDFPLSTEKKHKKILRGITSIMEKAGSDLGVVTPVNVEVCRSNWSEAEKITL